MTLTEIRKSMQSEEHIRHAIDRYEFQHRVHVRNPWEKLAAAIILQTLIDAVNNLDFDRMNDGWYWTLADSVGIDVPYETIRDNMLIRKYVFGESIPAGATNWLDEKRGCSKNTSPDMKNNIKRSDFDGGFTGVCIDGDSDFSVADLYDWFDNQ